MALLHIESFDDGLTFHRGVLTGGKGWSRSTSLEQNVGTARYKPPAGRSGQALNVNGSANYAMLQVSPSGTTIIVGFAVWPTNTSSVTPDKGFFYVGNADGPHFHLELSSGLDVQVYGAGDTLITTLDLNLPIQTWYYFEVKLTIGNAGVGNVVFRVDGVERYNNNFTGDFLNATGTATITEIAFGGDSSATTGRSLVYHYDDIYVCDDSGTQNNDFLGDIKVECLFPSGNGNYSQGLGSDGNSVDNYKEVMPLKAWEASDGTSITVPNDPLLQITGDIDLRYAALFNTTGISSALHSLLDRTSGSGSAIAYEFSYDFDSGFRLDWMESDGVTFRSELSTAAPNTVVSGWQFFLMRATLDVDNGAGAYEVKFYYKVLSDPSSVDIFAELNSDTGWSQLGTTKTGAATTTINAGTSDLFIGGAALKGAVFAGIIRNGIGAAGTNAFAFDFTKQPAGAQEIPDETGNFTISMIATEQQIAIAPPAPIAPIDYIESETGERDTFLFDDLSIINGAIKGVQVNAATFTAGGTATARLTHRQGVTDSDSGDKSVPSSLSAIKHVFEDNPSDSQDWEVADVNASEFGLVGQST